MEYFNSKKFIMILVILLVCAALSGCAKPKQIETQGPKQPSTLESIGRMDEIAIALGCMFNPSACEKENIKDKPHEGENN